MISTSGNDRAAWVRIEDNNSGVFIIKPSIASTSRFKSHERQSCAADLPAGRGHRFNASFILGATPGKDGR
jgi:hypothetical protein